MSAPVDVLAVMDAAEVRCGPDLAAAVAKARAAVAELVEAAELAMKWAEALPPGEPLHKESVADLNKARAALAKFGGAA